MGEGEMVTSAFNSSEPYLASGALRFMAMSLPCGRVCPDWNEAGAIANCGTVWYDILVVLPRAAPPREREAPASVKV